MTTQSRRQSGARLTCVVTFALIAGSVSQAAAQAARTNPLRSAPHPVAKDPSPVQQAQYTRHEPSLARTPTRPHMATASQPARLAPPGSAQGTRVSRSPQRGFVPRHQLVSDTQWDQDDVFLDPQVSPQPEVVHPGYMSGEDMFGLTDEYSDSGCCGQVVDTCGDCGACGTCLVGCPTSLLDYFQFFAGVQGFTAPLNRGQTASFGFHYGVNWAAPVPCMPNQPIGMQVGYRGVSANYSGASFTEDSRNQTFLTAGLFRRVDWGLQGGVVIDFLSDEWYYDKLNLTQLRGELSWMFPQSHELGVWFSAGTKTNVIEPIMRVRGQRVTLMEEYEATDLLAFFYRRRFDAVGGGHGRLFAGFSGNGEGLIGADFSLPLTENWALQSGFTYLIPKDGDNRVAFLEEAWNVGMTLVWYPGQRKSVGNDYFRPLFDVADNGNFIVRRL